MAPGEDLGCASRPRPQARPVEPKSSGRCAMTLSHILVGASTSPVRPAIRHIAPSDLWQSLKLGLDDFSAMPSHAIFLCAIYPLLGIILIGMTLGYTMLPMAFPIA